MKSNKTDIKELSPQKALTFLVIVVLIIFLIPMSIIYIFDPFYQYHSPILGNSSPLYDADNQMSGAIRHFNYDCLLVGDSLVENCNTDLLSNSFGGKFLKVVKSGGSISDLLWYTNQAEETRNIKKIFWCLDYSQLDSSAELSINSSLPNWYLQTSSPLDDGEYLLNKEIILKTIPTMIYNYCNGINCGANAFNWSAGKTFGADVYISRCPRDANAIPKSDDGINENISLDFGSNLNALCTQIENHPEIDYYFFVPPVSMGWWDAAYLEGEISSKLYIWENAITTLISFPNVKFYYYQNNVEIVCNLDNYMDLVHCSPQCDDWMIEEISSGDCEVTVDNYELFLSSTRKMVEYIESTAIKEYYH